MRSMDIPSFEDVYVCRGTAYSAVYALPVGELRKEVDHGVLSSLALYLDP